MNIVVPIKLVPDLVEELLIDESGTALDTTWMRFIINEFDDFAIDQAILIKERGQAQITVLAPDMEGAEDALFTAAAKGADRLIMVRADYETSNSHALARAFTTLIKELHPDLILTGVQAHDDLDGQVGPLIAGFLDYPYVGYVNGVTLSEGKLIVRKEYPGGLMGEMEVTLPAVLGIQSADEPPRYVAFSKVRQAMKTATIEEQMVEELNLQGAPEVSRLFQPEVSQRAAMLEGDIDEVTTQLLRILQDAGVL
jgi:electron transfer flavoprotein beta subunit